VKKEEKVPNWNVCDMLSAFLWHKSATHIGCGDILMYNRIGIEEIERKSQFSERYEREIRFG
jgi:hypothetical protein